MVGFEVVLENCCIAFIVTDLILFLLFIVVFPGDQRLITASSRQRGMRRSAESESDSELSAMEQSGLASSHSSDADDDTDSGWLVTRSQQEGGSRKNPDAISQPSGHSPNQTSPKQGSLLCMF